MTKAYLIDSAAQQVRVVEYDSAPGHDCLKTLQDMLGGYLEAAWRSPDGDVLFVDEEGLLKGQAHFFRWAYRPDQPLAGSGLYVGRELVDDEGEWTGNADPRASLGQIQRLVRFVGREWVDAWGKANASEPASTVTHFDETGRRETETVATWGQVLRDLPRPPEDDSTKGPAA